MGYSVCKIIFALSIDLTWHALLRCGGGDFVASGWRVYFSRCIGVRVRAFHSGVGVDYQFKIPRFALDERNGGGKARHFHALRDAWQYGDGIYPAGRLFPVWTVFANVVIFNDMRMFIGGSDGDGCSLVAKTRRQNFPFPVLMLCEKAIIERAKNKKSKNGVQTLAKNTKKRYYRMVNKREIARY